MAKSDPAHRNYADAEVSYDGADESYDEIDADRDADEANQSEGLDDNTPETVDGDSGDPPADEFPETLFDDEPKRKPSAKGPGHGDS